MSPRTPGCELPSSQPLGSGERTKSPSQHPTSNSKKHPNGEERQSSRPAVTPASTPARSLGSAQIDEKSYRWAKQQDRYQEFLAEAERRRLQRKEFDTRNKMWQKEKDKSRARLQAIEEERERLLQKMTAIDAAMAHYNAHHVVGVSKEIDQATQAKWTAYFNLETDELEV